MTDILRLPITEIVADFTGEPTPACPSGARSRPGEGSAVALRNALYEAAQKDERMPGLCSAHGQRGCCAGTKT